MGTMIVKETKIVICLDFHFGDMALLPFHVSSWKDKEKKRKYSCPTQTPLEVGCRAAGRGSRKQSSLNSELSMRFPSRIHTESAELPADVGWLQIS